MTAQHSMDTGFELASALLAAWTRADIALRSDLEQAIRAYIQRQPDFRDDLQEVIAVNEQLQRTHQPQANDRAAFRQLRIIVQGLTKRPDQ